MSRYTYSIENSARHDTSMARHCCRPKGVHILTQFLQGLGLFPEHQGSVSRLGVLQVWFPGQPYQHHLGKANP